MFSSASSMAAEVGASSSSPPAVAAENRIEILLQRTRKKAPRAKTGSFLNSVKTWTKKTFVTLQCLPREFLDSFSVRIQNEVSARQYYYSTPRGDCDL